MKKIYIALAVLATAALVSCEREKSFNEQTLEERAFAFRISGAAGTRSVSEAGLEAPKVIQLGKNGAASDYYFEEEVVDLNSCTPLTKGTPIYTENINIVDGYDKLGVIAYLGSDVYQDYADFESMDSSSNIEDNQPGWMYYHNYSGNFWENANGEDIYFFLNMPVGDSGASDMDYNTSDGSIEFDYASSLKGEDQNDILFSSRTLNKSQYLTNYVKTGAPVTMYHALTGVKFRTGHDNSSTTHTIITKVEFTGLYGSGHCVVTPDDADNRVVWDDLGTNGVTFTQEFKNPKYTFTKDENEVVTVTSGDGTVNLGASSNTYFNGTSLADAAADNNLNDEDGSLTFWFIPQAMSDEVILKVTFRVKTPDTPDGQEITHTIAFGEALSGVEWEAGQLRTYTLKPTDIDVQIFDTMEGLVKSGLHVTNTGNVDEYVRVMVIGNWVDSDGNILVGYETDGSDGDDTMVSPWFREDEKWGSYFDSSFTGGRPTSSSSKWKRGTGSYFYYTDVIGAGDHLSGTDALFQSYSLPETEIPVIYVPTTSSSTRVQAQGVHLEMEIVTQAISAYDKDGNLYSSCWLAWSAATGETISQKN